MKQSLLLAVLLCGVLALIVPARVEASSLPPAAEQESIRSTDDTLPFAFIAGEVASGGSEFMLQLDKVLFVALIQVALQQLYPFSTSNEAIPAFPYFKRNCGLYAILTQGP